MADHDRGYKRLFSQPRMVEDLLRGFVREPWVEELDFSTLERVSGSYVSDDLREREDDMVWRVRRGQGSLYIYLLLEFQSRPERLMALRILVYVGLLLQDLARRGERTPDGLLPPVLPIVLYNGRDPWSAPREVGELIAAVPGLARYQPRLRYLLIDEGRYAEAELASLRNLAAALFRLERSRRPEEVRQVVSALAEWLGDSGQSSLRRALLSWLREVLLPARLPGVEVPQVDDLREFQTMLEETVLDWTRQWKQEGLEEGRREGRRKGRREGRQEGRKEGEELVVLRLLERKFGPLGSELKARIAGADADQLLEWAERLLTAESLEDVFT